MYREAISLLQPTILVSRICGVCPSALRIHDIPMINKIYSSFLALCIFTTLPLVVWLSVQRLNDITAFVYLVFANLFAIQNVVFLITPFTNSKELVRFFMIMESAQQSFFNLNIKQPHTPTMTSQICWIAVIFFPVACVIVVLIYTAHFQKAIYAMISNILLCGTVCLVRVLMQLIDDKFSLLNWHLDDLNNRWPLFLPRPPDVSFRQLSCVAQWRSTKFILPSQDTRTVTTDKVKDFNKAHLKLYYAYKTLNSAFSLIALTLPLGSGSSIIYFCFSLFSKSGSDCHSLNGACSMLLILKNALVLTVLLTLASRIEKKNCQTAELVHDLLDEDRHSVEVQLELENFSIALLHRKANFSAAGFFDFDLKLVSRMACLMAPIILFLVQNNNRPRAGINQIPI